MSVGTVSVCVCVRACVRACVCVCVCVSVLTVHTVCVSFDQPLHQCVQCLHARLHSVSECLC